MGQTGSRRRYPEPSSSLQQQNLLVTREKEELERRVQQQSDQEEKQRLVHEHQQTVSDLQKQLREKDEEVRRQLREMQEIPPLKSELEKTRSELMQIQEQIKKHELAKAASEKQEQQRFAKWLKRSKAEKQKLKIMRGLMIHMLRQLQEREEQRTKPESNKRTTKKAKKQSVSKVQCQAQGKDRQNEQLEVIKQRNTELQSKIETKEKEIQMLRELINTLGHSEEKYLPVQPEGTKEPEVMPTERKHATVAQVPSERSKRQEVRRIEVKSVFGISGPEKKEEEEQIKRPTTRPDSRSRGLAREWLTRRTKSATSPQKVGTMRSVPPRQASAPQTRRPFLKKAWSDNHPGYQVAKGGKKKGTVHQEELEKEKELKEKIWEKDQNIKEMREELLKILEQTYAENETDNEQELRAAKRRSEFQGPEEQVKEQQRQQEHLQDDQQQATKLEVPETTTVKQLNDFQGQSERVRQEQQRVIELKETLQRKEQELIKLQGQLQKISRDNASLLDQFREEQQRADELRSQLTVNESEFQEKLKAKQNQVTQRKRELTRMTSQLRGKEEELTTFSEQVTRLQSQLSDREQRNAELRGRFTRKQQELTSVREQLNEFQRQERLSRAQQPPREEMETVRGQLDEKQQPEWIINRNDIQITDKELGRGAWGVVYSGRFHGCDVAVKQMHQALITSDYTRRVFMREVDMASKCRHPCLLQFIGATTDERRLLVTEILDCSLREKLHNEDSLPLSTNAVPAISRDVALGLNYLHQKRTPIIHHDVSSANVLLWQRGGRWRAKLSDYGTANFVRKSNIRHAGAVIYSAPEFLKGDQNQPISCKVDVYSFGVLLCEMIIREQPVPQQRRRQISWIENDHYRGLVERCVDEVPGSRPNMESIIEELSPIDPGEAGESQI